MSDYVIEGGPFQAAMFVFCEENKTFLDIIDAEQLIRMSAQVLQEGEGEGEEGEEGEGEGGDTKAKKDRVKFECPNNEHHDKADRQRAWAKPTAKLICGCCRTDMVVVNGKKKKEKAVN
jgi:S-methylmethionine-dependent homocysteine/selenocysteine methylase